MIDQSVRWQAGAGSEPAVAWPISSGRVPALADVFSPRPETGHGIEAYAAPDDLGQWPGGGQSAMTVLVGPSGFGKTHLDAAVAHALWRSGTSDLQVWINGSSRSAVLVGYAQAAGDIGL